MKNTKKIISLVLAICMLASLAISASAVNTVDASGGTGTSSVTLASTADGSLGGDPAATKMSVTVPTVLPIAVGTDGNVSTATDAKIVNNSFGAVKVNSVSIEAAQGWSLAAFGDKATLAHEKVNANKFGFSLCLGDGEKKMTDDKNASKQTLLTDAINGCFMSGVGDTSANSIGIAYGDQFKEILDEQTALKELRASILAENKEHAEADRRIRDAAGMLENAVPHIAEWDESAIRQLVAQVKVLSKNEISVTLKSGIEIRQSMSN